MEMSVQQLLVNCLGDAVSCFVREHYSDENATFMPCQLEHIFCFVSIILKFEGEKYPT